MRFKSIIILFLTLIILTACQSAKTEKIQKIDAYLSACYQQDLFNGNVLIAENGEILYKNSFGVRSYITGEPLTDQSQFRLASVTKQFTAMAVMILQERGELDYDDSMTKYIPELPYDNVTIRHLLTHTSGMADYEMLFDQHWDLAKKGQPDRQIANNDDVIRLFTEYKPPLRFKSGDKYEYSNTAYVFLASIVERVSGKTFDLFMKDNIYIPLGMTHSLIYSALKDPPMAERVYGFRKKILETEYSDADFHYLNGIVGDGAMYSTSGDLFLWDQSLYTEKLVSQKTLNQAFTPATLNNDSITDYGFGWRIQKTDAGKTIVSHSGGWVGFRTYIQREITDKNTLILLTNNSSLYASDIRAALLNIIHNQSYEIPKISIAQIIGPMIITEGIDSALVKYDQLKTSAAEKYNFSEAILNFLGYELLGEKKIKEAVEVFKLNVREYPESYNTYDSLGEAYMLDDQKDLALENYTKSLELNPDNTNARQMIQRIKSNK